MALGKIDHIDFYVDDLEKVEEYFTKTLGFKLLRHTMHGGPSIELESPAGDFFFDFHQDSEEGKQAMSVPRQFHPTFNHIAFKVDDINKEYEELKSKGVPVDPEDPGLNPDTGRILANITDANKRFWLQLSA